MRKICLTLSSALALATILALPTAALAQDAPPPEGATTPPPPAAPAEAAPAEPTPPPPATTAPADASASGTMSAEGTQTFGPGTTAEAPAGEAPGTAAPAEEEVSTPGWFRIDHDSFGLQLWVGATHALTDNIGLASDIYVQTQLEYAEFDIGPAFTLGEVALTPMMGVSFDWNAQTIANIVPQLFTIWNGQNAPLYFESWIQAFLFSPVMSDEEKFVGGYYDYLYTRNFLLFKASDDFAIGPHMELTYALNDENPLGEATVASLPVGGAAMLNYGKNNTLLLALMYETKEDARVRPDPSEEGSAESDGITGRFTFVRTW